MEANAKWEDDCEPVEDGWYAIHYCWDSIEGSFIGVDYYDKGWIEGLPVISYAGPFAWKKNAVSFATEHDISF